MKHVFTFLAVLFLLTAPAVANILVDDFENTTFSAGGTNPVHDEQVGWASRYTGWVIQDDGSGTNNVMYTSVTSPRNEGIWIDTTGLSDATSYQLKFDVIVNAGGWDPTSLFAVTVGENNAADTSGNASMSAKTTWAQAVYPTGAATTDILMADYTSSVANATTWTTITMTETFQIDGDSRLYIGFAVDTGPSSDNISIDNVMIVPEPATMGLLAFGGLGVLLRRKRR